MAASNENTNKRKRSEPSSKAEWNDKSDSSGGWIESETDSEADDSDEVRPFRYAIPSRGGSRGRKLTP